MVERFQSRFHTNLIKIVEVVCFVYILNRFLGFLAQKSVDFQIFSKIITCFTKKLYYETNNSAVYFFLLQKEIERSL